MQSNSFKQCKVCETKENVCFHYGVITCRACGAFFRYFLFCFIWKNSFKRRYLENEKKSKYSRCICLQKQLWEKCKKCRLDKCFSVGMKKLGLSKYLKIILESDFRNWIFT